MKRYVILLSILMVGLLAVYIQTVRAVEKTYEWKSYHTYHISLFASENWQPNTLYEVTVRFTKIPSNTYYPTKTNSVKVILTSENFVIDSLNEEETPDLVELSDYWEKKFALNIPEDKLGRGQTLNTSIVVLINIRRAGHSSIWNNYDDPMTVNLNRPFLSTLELSIVAGVIVVIAGITGFAVYKRKVSSQA